MGLTPLRPYRLPNTQSFCVFLLAWQDLSKGKELLQIPWVNQLNGKKALDADGNVARPTLRQYVVEMTWGTNVPSTTTDGQFKACCSCEDGCAVSTVSQAYFALHETLHIFKKVVYTGYLLYTGAYTSIWCVP
jgi:hypothetical protein